MNKKKRGQKGKISFLIIREEKAMSWNLSVTEGRGNFPPLPALKTEYTEAYYLSRACLKNHFQHAPFCAIFAPNSGYIARYAPFIWHKIFQRQCHLCQPFFHFIKGTVNSSDFFYFYTPNVIIFFGELSI